jgi:hypothetical protein
MTEHVAREQSFSPLMWQCGSKVDHFHVDLKLAGFPRRRSHDQVARLDVVARDASLEVEFAQAGSGVRSLKQPQRLQGIGGSFASAQRAGSSLANWTTAKAMPRRAEFYSLLFGFYSIHCYYFSIHCFLVSIVSINCFLVFIHWIFTSFWVLFTAIPFLLTAFFVSINCFLVFIPCIFTSF